MIIHYSAHSMQVNVVKYHSSKMCLLWVSTVWRWSLEMPSTKGLVWYIFILIILQCSLINSIVKFMNKTKITGQKNRSWNPKQMHWRIIFTHKMTIVWHTEMKGEEGFKVTEKKVHLFVMPGLEPGTMAVSKMLLVLKTTKQLKNLKK